MVGAGLTLTMDDRLKHQIKLAVDQGITHSPEIQRMLDLYVTSILHVRIFRYHYSKNFNDTDTCISCMYVYLW